jgi:hypothetical protein
MRGHFAYRDAKDAKDDRSLPAAVVLVLDLISDSGVTRVREIVGERRIKIVGVHAQEARGRNKIPVAYAEILAHVLDQNAVPEIIQSSIANHSAAPSIYHRMVAQPAFEGPVDPGALYVIVDDICTAGGTLANLKGHIEINGGEVIGMSTLASNSPGEPYYISLADQTLARLKYRHRGLDSFWKEEFGYGLECLTEGEAGHLLKAPTVDAIRKRLAEARRDLDL